MVRARLRQLAGSRDARNSGWMALGLSARLVTQALYFILIARSLGAREYGLFVGSAALVSLITPFASCGTGNLLVQEVSRRPQSFSAYWGLAVRTTLLAAFPVGVIAFAVASLVLPPAASVLLLLSILASDVLFARLIDVSGQAFQAFGELGRTAVTSLSVSLLRLAAAAWLLTIVGGGTAGEWAILYLLTSLVAAVGCTVWVSRTHGAPDFRSRMTRSQFSQGFHFSLTQSAQLAYSDSDKALLVRMASSDVAGAYASAFRVVEIAWLPVRAVLWSSYARFFKLGEDSPRAALKHALRLLSIGGAYGMLVAASLFALAPLFPLVVGSEFALAVEVLRGLALLVLLRTVHYVLGDALTGSGFHRIRSWLQVGAAAVNIALNMTLIPAFSWRGAVWSALATDALLALAMLWIATVRLSPPAPRLQ